MTIEEVLSSIGFEISWGFCIRGDIPFGYSIIDNRWYRIHHYGPSHKVTPFNEVFECFTEKEAEIILFHLDLFI